MSTTFRPYVPDQSLLLPPDVREWLPEGHLAHHVSDLVDGLDLTAFYALYEGDGRRNAPYEPRMMVKVLLYAYATGVFSSRRVARKLEEDVVSRRLAAHDRLRDAAYHWARVAAQRDPASRAKYQALRSRGHGHARSLRSVADRLLNVACAMLRDGACFDPHRVGITAT